MMDGNRIRAFLSSAGDCLLSLDPGILKCGYAVGACSGAASRSLGVARAPRGSSPAAAAALFAHVAFSLARTHGAGGFIVGSPGDDVAGGAAARHVCAALSTAPAQLPILPWDERGSTVAARAMMRDAAAVARVANGRARGPRRALPRDAPVDGVAAAVILDSFLVSARGLK